MLRVIESSRRHLSAGLLAVAIFSTACVDNELPQDLGADAGSTVEKEELEVEAIHASDSLQSWTPVVTALAPRRPRPTRMRMARKPAIAVETSLVDVQSEIEAVETDLVVQPEIEPAPEAKAEPVQNDAGPETRNKSLRRQTMLGDDYAAFGAGRL